MDEHSIMDINIMLLNALLNERLTRLFLKKIFKELDAIKFNYHFSDTDMFVNDLRNYEIKLDAPLAWYRFSTSDTEQFHLLIGDTDNQIVKTILLDPYLMSNAKVLVIETYHDDKTQRSYDEENDHVKYILLPLLYKKAKEKLETTNDITSLNKDEFVAYCIYEPNTMYNETLNQEGELKDMYKVMERIRNIHQKLMKEYGHNE